MVIICTRNHEKDDCMDLKDLVGTSLTEFSVLEYTEVFRVDEDGHKRTTLGFFQDDSIAIAWKNLQKDSNFCQTQKALVLTDGTNGFMIGPTIEILNDERATLAIRKGALDKLSPEEKKVLGL
ncbi:MAG: hypothetical protein BWY51_00125 [Parcubacteria group bacterium ADurb.Bin316]|nr:MAG: hypothetical protein BWY51_00125 [Parcubacteria group bacterium ADurb.Bin316]